MFIDYLSNNTLKLPYLNKRRVYNIALVPALAACQNKDLKAVPAKLSLKLAHICLQQYLISAFGSTLDNASSSPCFTKNVLNYLMEYLKWSIKEPGYCTFCLSDMKVSCSFSWTQVMCSVTLPRSFVNRSRNHVQLSLFSTSATAHAMGNKLLFPSLPTATKHTPGHCLFRWQPSTPIMCLQPCRNPSLQGCKQMYIL